MTPHQERFFFRRSKGDPVFSILKEKGSPHSTQICSRNCCKSSAGYVQAHRLATQGTVANAFAVLRTPRGTVAVSAYIPHQSHCLKFCVGVVAAGTRRVTWFLSAPVFRRKRLTFMSSCLPDLSAAALFAPLVGLFPAGVFVLASAVAVVLTQCPCRHGRRVCLERSDTFSGVGGLLYHR